MQPQQVYYDAQGRPYTVPASNPTPATAYAQSQLADPSSTGPPFEAGQPPTGGPAGGVPGGQSGASQSQSQVLAAPGAGGTQETTTETMPVAGPLIDVVEHPRSVEVFIDMPGFDEDDIQLDADAQTLRVLAEREGNIEQSDEAVVLQRERPQRFERTVQIPVRVDVDEAEASYKAGVCHISLPKSEAAERSHTRIGFH